MARSLINDVQLQYDFQCGSVCGFTLQSTVDIFRYCTYRGTVVRGETEERIREQYVAPPPSTRFVDSVHDGFSIAVEHIVGQFFDLRLIANTPLSGECSRA